MAQALGFRLQPNSRNRKDYHHGKGSTSKRGLKAVQNIRPLLTTLSKTSADKVLKTTSTQKEAIDWAKANWHSPHVARVRHLNDKKNPDHWRAV